MTLRWYHSLLVTIDFNRYQIDVGESAHHESTKECERAPFPFYFSLIQVLSLEKQ